VTASSSGVGGPDDAPTSSGPPMPNDLLTVHCPKCKGCPPLREGAPPPAVPGLCLTCCGHGTVDVHWASIESEQGKPMHQHLFLVNSMPREALCDDTLVDVTRVGVLTASSLPCIPCVMRATELADVDERVHETTSSFQREIELQNVGWLHPSLQRPGPQDVEEIDRVWLNQVLKQHDPHNRGEDH
jgi:hypothetical protein